MYPLPVLGEGADRNYDICIAVMHFCNCCGNGCKVGVGENVSKAGAKGWLQNRRQTIRYH